MNAGFNSAAVGGFGSFAQIADAAYVSIIGYLWTSMVPVTSKEIARTLDNADICKRLSALQIFAAISMKAMYRVVNLTPQRIICSECDFNKRRDCDEERKENFFSGPARSNLRRTDCFHLCDKPH